MAIRNFKNKFRRRGRVVLRDCVAVYHVICRAALQQFIFDPESKDMFRRMLYKQARFAGLEVLSYCLMDNHFHLLLRVPVCPLREPGCHLIDDAEILRRYAAFYGPDCKPVSTYSVAELTEVMAAGGEEAEVARQTVLARMGDLSAFMRELKQRFVIWYNATSGNVGTVWTARFKSLLVENASEVLTRVAAYIDLNPVRAGIVKDPSAYNWSSYGAAMQGCAKAERGLRGLFPGDKGPANTLLRAYKLILYGIGVSRGKLRLEEASATHTVDEGLDPWCKRLRQLSRGVALGSRSFVESFLRLRRGAVVSPPNGGLHSVGGGLWSEIFTNRKPVDE